MKVFDLSQTIESDMPVYPGDQEISLKQDKFLATDFYNNFILNSSMHVGTHIDGPMHMTKSKKGIDDFELEHFMGQGVVLNCLNEAIIDYKAEYETKIQTNDIVLIYTGQSRLYGTPEYFQHPIITEALAKFLIRKHIKMVGVDGPSPDSYPFDCHKLFFQNGIFIIENLCQFEHLLPLSSFWVMAIPLKIKADSSISRVIALEM